jgi:predicted Na+-dependent transporter
MKLLVLPINLLAYLGRHGTLAIALSLLVGIALPFLAATMRPLLDEAILTLLTMAFMRIGFRALGGEFRTPLPVLYAVLIALFALPAMVLYLAGVAGIAENYPDIYLALFIALAVPPITSVPIFASLLRLPGAIALAFLVLMMLFTPLAATLHAKLFFQAGALPFDGVAIGLRMAGFMLTAAMLAMIIQKLVGPARLMAWRPQLDGINVLTMLVFAIAVMDGFGAAILDKPALVAGLLGATFTLALFQMGLMRAALWFLDAEKALAIAFATGLRNMALMVASLGLAIPDTTWLWFAVGQFPIYFMPWLIELSRRARRPAP